MKHLRLILGTSMGSIDSWVWGETYPDFMDALMPLACQPVQIAGRNRIWRKMVIDGVRDDSDWKNSGTRNCRTRNQTSEERPFRADSDLRANPWSRYSHLGCGVAAVSEGVAGGLATLRTCRSGIRLVPLRGYLWRAFSLSRARFNSSSFCPASPSLPSAVSRW